MNSSSRVLLCNVDGAQVLRMLTRLVNYLIFAYGTEWNWNQTKTQFHHKAAVVANNWLHCKKMKFTNAQMIEENKTRLMVVVSSCCEMVVVHPSDTL